MDESCDAHPVGWAIAPFALGVKNLAVFTVPPTTASTKPKCPIAGERRSGTKASSTDTYPAKATFWM
jgi:hypothetical protein